jgi:hypothetical protein
VHLCVLTPGQCVPFKAKFRVLGALGRVLGSAVLSFPWPIGVATEAADDHFVAR